MRKPVPVRHLLILAIFGLTGIHAVWSEGLSGKINQEFGLQQEPGGTFQLYQYSHGLLEFKRDIQTSFAIDLAGEYNWQTSASNMELSWPVYYQENGLELEKDYGSDTNGQDFLSLRLSRAALQYSSGRLDVVLGLQEFDWGSSRFYRPTCFFNPLPPLTWSREMPLGSEGVDASCFLFDYLSLEAGARWLKDGTFEEVIRLVNRGIGITVTPSFALMSGRNGLGLELVGTFPDFKARFEGVDWLYPGGNTSMEWVAGLSTVHEGATYTVELIEDGDGSVLGGFSNKTTKTAYISPSFEKDFSGGWHLVPSLAFSLEGGSLLFWPKGSWDFSPSLECGIQAQIMMGPDQGPLALNPTRLGTWVAYSF